MTNRERIEETLKAIRKANRMVIKLRKAAPQYRRADLDQLSRELDMNACRIMNDLEDDDRKRRAEYAVTHGLAIPRD